MMADEPSYEQLYRDLAQSVRLIREAVELTFGPIELPAGHGWETPVRECEAIARAIYSQNASAGRAKDEAAN